MTGTISVPVSVRACRWGNFLVTGTGRRFLCALPERLPPERKKQTGRGLLLTQEVNGLDFPAGVPGLPRGSISAPRPRTTRAIVSSGARRNE